MKMIQLSILMVLFTKECKEFSVEEFIKIFDTEENRRYLC